MYYLVLGANGMAGHMISLFLAEKGHHVVGFARKKASHIENSIIGDVTNTNELDKALSYYNFDVVVNCVGVLNKVAEENKANAVYINSFLPHYLEDRFHNSSTRIIHLSTDCVFSGDKGHYKDTDRPDGVSFYAKTKALGEIKDQNNLTIRTSIIGPDLNKSGIGLFNWFMNQNNAIEGYSNVIWSGVTTLQLAKMIELLSENNCSGLVQLVPENSISKYELLNLINYHFRNNSIFIAKETSNISDKSLIPSVISIPVKIPSYEDMLIELKEWMHLHSALYSHYLNIEGVD